MELRRHDLRLSVADKHLLPDQSGPVPHRLPKHHVLYRSPTGEQNVLLPAYLPDLDANRRDDHQRHL